MCMYVCMLKTKHDFIVIFLMQQQREYGVRKWGIWEKEGEQSRNWKRKTREKNKKKEAVRKRIEKEAFLLFN